MLFNDIQIPVQLLYISLANVGFPLFNHRHFGVLIDTTYRMCINRISNRRIRAD